MFWFQQIKQLIMLYYIDTLQRLHVNAYMYQLQTFFEKKGWLLMGMVVIQPYILASKLKKAKTKSLYCTGYLNSTKPYKARFIANSSFVRQQNFLNC